MVIIQLFPIVFRSLFSNTVMIDAIYIYKHIDRSDWC